MLGKASADSEDVGIKNDVLRIETNLFNQDAVRTLAHAHLFFIPSSLAILIESHHHNSSTMNLDSTRLLFELGLALLQTDGVDDALALAALDTSFDNVELGRIDHKGDLGDLRVGHQQINKAGHSSNTVNETIIHVNIKHVSTLVHLGKSNASSLIVVTVHNSLLVNGRTSNIATLTQHQESGAVVSKVGLVVQRLKTTQTKQSRDIMHRTRLIFTCHLGNSSNMLRTGAAAATDGIHKILFTERTNLLSHLRTVLVVSTHGIR